jgi:hypothetical protein
MNRAAKKHEKAESNPRFDRIVKALTSDPQVSRGEGKGFGSGALKVNGRIFAMMTSKGEFVVKLSKERVDELVDAGKGKRFDPGHGRLMKEWFVAGKGVTDWLELAKEAREFVKP